MAQPRLAIEFGIDVLLETKIALRQIEDVTVGIVRTVSREGADWRALHCLQCRIEFADTCDRVFQIVYLDPEMIDSRTTSFAPRNAIQPNIAVANDDSARWPGFARRLHTEEGFIEARVDRVMIRCDRDMIDLGTHCKRAPNEDTGIFPHKRNARHVEWRVWPIVILVRRMLGQ
jgi:hypothetical protein